VLQVALVELRVVQLQRLEAAAEPQIWHVQATICTGARTAKDQPLQMRRLQQQHILLLLLLRLYVLQ
jgi:hypothetical protein